MFYVPNFITMSLTMCLSYIYKNVSVCQSMYERDGGGWCAVSQEIFVALKAERELQMGYDPP